MSRDASWGIGVGDGAVVDPVQPSDARLAIDCGSAKDVADCCLVDSDQPTNCVPACDATTDQANIADHAAAVGVTDQTDIVGPATVDSEVGEGMTQPDQSANERFIPGPHRHPVTDAAQVDIATHGVVAVSVVVYGLQRLGIVDHVVGERVAGQAFLRAEVQPALQIDRRLEVVVRRATTDAGLAVLQRDLAIGVPGSNGGVDIDVVMGAESERGARIPSHGGVDVDIARFGAGIGGDGLQGDVGARQVDGERVGAHATVSLGCTARADGEVGRVDQPGTGLAILGQGGDLGAVRHLDVSTRGFDKTAVAAARRTGVEGAGHLYAAAIEAAKQDDLAVLLANRLRFDGAGVVDHGVDQHVTGIGSEQYLAAIGLDQLVVFHQRIDHRLVHLHVEQTVAGKVQGHRIARRQGHAALVGDDHPVVADRAAEQGDAAAIGGADLAVVDHRSVLAVALERVVAGLEVAVADVQGRGHPAADIDLGVLAEQYAVGVDEEHPAIGIELAHDLRAIGAQNPVQRNRIAAGLVEGHLVAGGDIEALPVDGELVAGLVDNHLVIRRQADLPLPRRHLAASR